MRKKRETRFYEFPQEILEQLMRARQARSSSGKEKEEVVELTLPWQMKYFSPMLRG